MTVIGIADIEAAINAWRNRKPTHDDANGAHALCREARVLADVWGEMIYEKRASIDAAKLTQEQAEAYRAAFA